VTCMDGLSELVEMYRTDKRTHADSSAWLMVNMITSIDGAIAVEGLSGGLGNEADFAVFKTLRGLADVILVGAGTAGAESYKVPSPNAAGVRPVIAVVSRRLSIDLESALFADPTYRPAVVTTTDADAALVGAIAQVADVVAAGVGQVDVSAAVQQLAARFGPTILAEGGPTLNAQLAADDLVDELCVTTSPLVIGGAGGRMLANGPVHDPRSFVIDRSVPIGGLVFARYLRQR
jgi:riboflavin biosynthesis pyrimidine reductase